MNTRHSLQESRQRGTRGLKASSQRLGRSCAMWPGILMTDDEVAIRVAGLELDDGGGAAMTDHAARPHVLPNGERPAVAIEENDVDREAHAEGMDGATAQNEKRPPLGRPPAKGKPARPEPPRVSHHQART